MTVEIDGHSETITLKPKEFKTGSKGFFASGKLEVEPGVRYQITANIVLIGSKGGD